jgi:hypothetical protein
MRKFVTLSAVAALALAVTACGKTETVNAADANVTEMNTTEAVEGTTNDSMTNVDAAAGASDNMMAGNAMGDTTTNAMGNATSTNASDNSAAAK